MYFCATAAWDDKNTLQAVERTQINVSALGCHYELTKRPTCYSFNIPQYIQFL